MPENPTESRGGQRSRKPSSLHGTLYAVIAVAYAAEFVQHGGAAGVLALAYALLALAEACEGRPDGTW